MRGSGSTAAGVAVACIDSRPGLGAAGGNGAATGSSSGAGAGGDGGAAKLIAGCGGFAVTTTSATTTASATAGATTAGRHPVSRRPRRIGCSTSVYDAAASATVTATRSENNGHGVRPVRAEVSHRNTGQWKR